MANIQDLIKRLPRQVSRNRWKKEAGTNLVLTFRVAAVFTGGDK
jgi:hypothetical protein